MGTTHCPGSHIYARILADTNGNTNIDAREVRRALSSSNPTLSAITPLAVGHPFLLNKR